MPISGLSLDVLFQLFLAVFLAVIAPVAPKLPSQMVDTETSISGSGRVSISGRTSTFGIAAEQRPPRPLVWLTSDNLRPNPLAPHPHHTFLKKLWCRCGVTTPYRRHNFFKKVWCGCGVGVVPVGLGEGCHLWATV